MSSLALLKTSSLWSTSFSPTAATAALCTTPVIALSFMRRGHPTSAASRKVPEERRAVHPISALHGSLLDPWASPANGFFRRLKDKFDIAGQFGLASG